MSTVLHVRDTDADAAEFAGYNLTADKMDIARLSFWLLQSKSGRAAGLTRNFGTRGSRWYRARNRRAAE